MIFITGDTHSDFSRFDDFCAEYWTTQEDIMIILGDVGLNYFGDERDLVKKQEVSRYPITFFCIHGNHEQRPATISTYKTRKFCGGEVWYEEEFPSILFAKDGEIYDFGGTRCLVIGGAYSVDKPFRLAHGWHWFEDEQPDEETKRRVEARLAMCDWCVDAVLSHTCPLKAEPVEVFLEGIDQSCVDKSTEQWLDTIEERLEYRNWYCGHYHTSRRKGKVQFMFLDIEDFEEQNAQ